MTSTPAGTTASPQGARLVMSMLKIGAIGFGGGSALIPLMDDEVVRRRRVLDRETFTRHTVVASLTPGALPVKLAGLTGLEVSSGWLAATLAVVVAVPGTLLALLFVAALSSSDQAVLHVEYASIGISAFIIALLIHYAATVFRRSRQPAAAVTIAVLAALATGTPTMVRVLGVAVGQGWQVNVPRLTAAQLIGTALAIIVIRTLVRGRRGTTGLTTTSTSDGTSLWPTARRAAFALSATALTSLVAALVVVGPQAGTFLALVAGSTVSSFGGGEAYVAVADGFFVSGGFLDSTTYYTQLVPIANALPGPILVKLAAVIGYVVAGGGVGGWVLGTAAALVAIATCTLIAILVLAIYRRVSTSPLLTDLGAHVLPVIVGMLITTAASMVVVSSEVATRADLSATLIVWLSLAVATAVTILRRNRRIPDLAVLLICAAASVAGFLIAGR